MACASVPQCTQSGPRTLTRVLLSDYEGLLALGDLRGGNEYDAEIVNDEGLVEHTRVNGIVVAALSRKDGASLSLVIELDERGEVIQDWFGQEPAKEMNGWPNVNWQPFPLGRSPDDFVRLVFGDE